MHIRFAILAAFLFSCSSCWTIYREVPAKSPAKNVSATTASTSSASTSASTPSAPTTAAKVSPARNITLQQYRMRVSLGPALKKDSANYRVELGFHEITTRSHLDLSDITLSLSAYEKNQPPYVLQKIESVTQVKTGEGTVEWKKTSYQSLKNSSGIDLPTGDGYFLVYFFRVAKGIHRSRHLQVTLSLHAGDETITRTIRFKKGKEVELLH